MNETILSEIEEREKSQRKKYEEQKQRMKDRGYSERKTDSILGELMEEHPLLESLFLREMYWSRVRELEEVKKIIEIPTKEQAIRVVDWLMEEWSITAQDFVDEVRRALKEREEKTK